MSVTCGALIYMVITCSVCREVVHVYAGYVVRHGATHNGLFSVCAGSGVPVCGSSDCCI